MNFTPLPIALIFLFSTSLSSQTIRYVNHAASGNTDGSSWANAFTRLQQALAMAQDGDEIWVAQGTYKPTTSNDRFAFYNLPSGVKVYGGFAGSETQIEQRDWVTNLTILSGDIGVPGDSTDNSFNILYSYSPNEKTHLDGLIFEEGNATNTDNNIEYYRPTRSGGGIYLDGEGFGYAQLSVSNCTFRRNRALYQGGGMYANGTNGGMAIVQFENCLFEQNTSGYFGGGFSLENDHEQPFGLEVKGCEFWENSAVTGSAIWLKANQPATITDCVFLRNKREFGGGSAVYFETPYTYFPYSIIRSIFRENGDQTIKMRTSEPIIESCVFEQNGLPVLSIWSEFNAQVKNCVFAFNKPVSSNSPKNLFYFTTGSGIGEGKAFVANCVLYKNEGVELLNWPVSSVTHVSNSIIINDPNDGLPQLVWGATSDLITYQFDHCLFRHPSCDSLTSVNTAIILCDSTNLFGLDPLFANPSISDFHLQACSPAINAGMNAILDSLGITTDLDGNPRIRNEVVDMGPYEKHVSLHPSVSSQPACAGESDGAVTFNPDICPPFSFEWSNGVTTGTNTDGLAAGAYVFSATGTNNIPVSDTVIIHEPSPLVITAQTQNAHCYGAASGQIETFVSGGTVPYQYHWDPPLPALPSHYNLQAGTYFLTVTDTNGCTGTAQMNIGSPDPIQVFYTTQNVSCMGCSDGSIVFDSIIGGTNPPLPASLVNIPVGYYCLTITDAAGCTVAPCFTITVSVDATEETLNHALKLSPNPTKFGETALLEWLDNEPATLRVMDLNGRVMKEKRMTQNTSTRLQADWPPGIYLVEIQTISGKRAALRWAIFGR